MATGETGIGESEIGESVSLYSDDGKYFRLTTWDSASHKSISLVDVVEQEGNTLQMEINTEASVSPSQELVTRGLEIAEEIAGGSVNLGADVALDGIDFDRHESVRAPFMILYAPANNL